MADTHITPLALAAASPVVAGPLMATFNELGLTLAIMGCLGGAVHFIASKAPIKRALRPVIIGGLLGFGVGAVGPILLSTLFGVDLKSVSNTVEGLAAVSFLVGIVQERLLAYISGDRDAQ